MPAAAQSHILVVQRDAVTRKLLVGVLGSKGYATYEAAGGDEAVPFLQKNLSLLVLDIEDGNVDSLGLMRKLQREYGRLPLIALTEEEDHDALRLRLNIPDITILQKPVLPEALLRNIETRLVGSIEEKMSSGAKVSPVPPSGEEEKIKEQRASFMRRAVDLSQQKMDENQGGPFGAVIVKDGKIIGEGWNLVTSSNDPTAHAEIVAIRNAAAAIGDYSLEGAEIYTSCEPCPMCLAALYWARIDRIFYGNTREDAERIGFDDDFIYREIALPEHRRSLPATMLLRDEAAIVFSNWMKKTDKTPY